MPAKIPYFDSKGKMWESMSEYARAHDINCQTFINRLRRMRDRCRVESACLMNGTKNFVYDHKGNRFVSVSALARAYCLSVQIVRSRIKKGWKMEDVLSAPAHMPEIKYRALKRKGLIKIVEAKHGI